MRPGRLKHSLWNLPFLQVQGTQYSLNLCVVAAIALLSFETYRSTGSDLAALQECLSYATLLLLYELIRGAVFEGLGLKPASVTIYPFGSLSDIESSCAIRPSADDLHRSAKISGAGDEDQSFDVFLEQHSKAQLRSSLLKFQLLRKLTVAPLCMLGLALVLFFVHKEIWPEAVLLWRLACALLVLGIMPLLPVRPFPGSFWLYGGNEVERGSRPLHLLLALSIILSSSLLAYALHSPAFLLAVLVFAILVVENYIYYRSIAAAAPYLVRDVLIPIENMLSLSHGQNCQECLDIALKSFQNVFPVLHRGELIGLVEKSRLIEPGAYSEAPMLIGEVLDRDYLSVEVTTPLIEVINLFRSYSDTAIVVADNKRMLGLIIRDRLYEFLVLHRFDPGAHSKQGMPDEWFNE